MIDTSSWKSFKISDLFVVSRGQRHVVGNHEDGNLPYYSASLDNNGVTDYISNPLFIDKDAVVVTTFGDAFYAKGDFTASDEITILHHIKMNELSGLFIASAIRQNKWKYSFKVKAFKERVSNDSISLPATSDGQPDWDYMESYMKAVMEESEKSLEYLKKADNARHLIDVSGWGGFRIGDLFEKLQAPCNNKKAKREIISEIPDESHTLPLVYAAKRNNGIIYWGNEKDFTAYSNVISIIYNGAVAAGTVYAQEQNTGILAESYFIRLKNNPDVSFYVNLYLSRIIENVIYNKYTRDDLAVWDDKVENCYIKLPITSTGEPDWRYMEDYMKNIMNKQEMAADNLSKIA